MRCFFRVPIAAVAVAVAVAGCGSADDSSDSVVGDFSGPLYESVDHLAADADSVVYGQVIAEHSRGIDQLDVGLELPTVFYEFRVRQVLRGRDHRDDVIIVQWWDLDLAQNEDASRISVGDEFVLFADYWNAANDNVPGIETVGAAYVPLMWDQGVLDLGSDGRVTPRAETLKRLTPRSPRAEGWSLGQIRRTVRDARVPTPPSP